MQQTQKTIGVQWKHEAMYRPNKGKENNYGRHTNSETVASTCLSVKIAQENPACDCIHKRTETVETRSSSDKYVRSMQIEL